MRAFGVASFDEKVVRPSDRSSRVRIDPSADNRLQYRKPQQTKLSLTPRVNIGYSQSESLCQVR
jgi:hypothetical protein